MRKVALVLFLWSLLCHSTSYTQIVKVIDRTDLQGVTDVFIYSNSTSSLTNQYGKADLDMFGKNDTLNFQHRSFLPLRLTMEQLRKDDFLVKLTPALIQMNEVLVSQNKWEQNKREIPNKIEAVKSKDVGFYNPQTTAELVGLSDQVFIQKSQLGGGSPMIRGFAANRVLLVIDGVRLNNAIYRSGNLQNVITLDPNIMENSEVIFGPGSVIYGSDALGGVMDFHTRDVKLSTDQEAYLKFNASSRFSSANLEKTGHFDVSYGSKKWGILSSISFSDFDDQRMGSKGFPEYQRQHYVTTMAGIDSVRVNPNPDNQLFTGYSQLNLMQKFRFRPSNTINLTYDIHYSNSSDIPRYDRLIQYSQGLPKYAEWYYGPTKWLMHRLGVELSDSTPFFDKLRITMAYQSYSESRHNRQLNDEWLSQRFEYLDIAGINIDADRKINENHDLYYGLEWVSNRVFSQGMQRNVLTEELVPESSRYPDGGTLYLIGGLYAGIKNRITKKINITSGIRANYFTLQSKFISKDFFDFPYDEILINNMAVNGSLGLTYLPSGTWQLNLNVSTGYRAPNLDDVGKVFDSEPGTVIVPNENLKPEYAVNTDFGIIKRLGDKVKIDITGYYTYLFDAMVRREFTFGGADSIMYDGELSKVEAVVNTDEAWLYGISAAMNYSITGKFLFRSSFTKSFGFETGDVPARHVPPGFGASHLIYQANKIRCDFYVRYNGEKAFSDMPPSEISKPDIYAADEEGQPYSPSWYTLNFVTAYQITSFLQFNFGIENILDARYRPFSSGFVAPGRNLFVTLRASI